MYSSFKGLQHQIELNDPVRNKFESKIPVCTSYILASLQYENRIANYHQLVMEMCLMLFKSAQPFTMRNIANLDIALISQLWIPVEFVGDYITQRLCLKLIAAVLEHLNVEERQRKVSDAKLKKEIEQLILKLSADPNNFEEISRELLNVYNMTFSKTCTVFSIYCTKALFGSFELFKPDNVSNFWIDFNYTSKSVSLLCQLNKSERKQEEFYIKIKIDKLQIENQFDCTVYTIQQATFSTNVSAVLLNSRVAVFTLPANQLDLLKANSDLIDYYNSFSYQESSEHTTPKTIAKYLAELGEDSSLPSYSEQSDITKMKSARVKIHKYDVHPKNKDSTKTKNQLENNRTVDVSPLVSRVEYLPNYVGPSIGINESDANTTNEESVFKKPFVPAPLKSRKRVQTVNMQYKLEKLPAYKTISMLRNKNVNVHQREIISPNCSKKESKMATINDPKQNNSTRLPIFKSRKKKLGSERRNLRKLTTDEISYSFTTIQITTDSHKQQVKQQDLNKIQKKLIEESSLLEISLDELGNANNQSVETITHKSVDDNSFSFSEPVSSRELLKPNLKESEIIEIPSQILAPVFPVHQNHTKSIDMSHCVEISEHQKTFAQNPCASKEVSNSSNLSKDIIYNPNFPLCPKKHNRHTLPQSPHNESKISQNKSISGKTSKSLTSEDHQQSTKSLENIAPGRTNDTKLRFFKHKRLPKMDCSTKTNRVKQKTRTQKNNMTKNQPKAKSVNLVKPLNYVPDPSLSITQHTSESKERPKSKRIGSQINDEKDKAKCSKLYNEAYDDSKLIVINAARQESILKPNKRRTNKRKTLIKQVKGAGFVPYSIWKIGQNERPSSESVILAEAPTLQTNLSQAPKLQTDWLPSNHSGHFDRVKHRGTKNQSNTSTLQTSLTQAPTLPTDWLSTNYSDHFDKVKHGGTKNVGTSTLQTNLTPASTSQTDWLSSNPSDSFDKLKHAGTKIESNTSTLQTNLTSAPTLQTDWLSSNQSDPFDKVKHGGSKNVSNPTNDIDYIPRRRRSSSSPDSILTCYSPESKTEIRSSKCPSPLEKKQRSSPSIDIIRYEKSVDMIQSPVEIPSHLARERSKSVSMEDFSTSKQMPLYLDSLEVLNSFQRPFERDMLLDNITTNIASPVYEDLDDELLEDPSQPETFQTPNTLVDEFNEEVPQPRRYSSDSEDENQQLLISPDIQLSMLSQTNKQTETSKEKNTDSQFVEGHLKHKLAEEHKSSSSRDSSISIYLDGEQGDFTNQIIQKQGAVTSFRKRTHSAEDEEPYIAKIASLAQCSSLEGYDRLLPQFVKKLTSEKNRILGNIKTKLNEDIFKSFTKTVEEVTKAIESHQAAIQEEQEKLISVLENIEWHHQVLLKNQSELEKIHDQVIEHQKLWDTKTRIDELYKEAEDNLLSYADALKRDHWHSFSKVIIDSLNERLTELLNI